MRDKLLAEFLGTYFLVFACTGAIVIETITHALTSLGTALVAGLVVMALIYSFHHISGAHFNPAVTVSFWLLGLISAPSAFLYIASQILGALAASGTVLFLFGDVAHLGATLPVFSWHQTFWFEFLLTFWLMMVIFWSSVHEKAAKSFAGLAVGGMVALAALIGGPVSGASMNPARSLAPALLSGDLDSLWVYLAATTLGTVAATALFRKLNP
ncbi:aquaporin [Tumebacillus sp. ITR2]|uniref:Aquaporin n=1 Tax=Tumebacillus amylolyticus TaxID=2801339 RepID=A0ABS1JDH1_9BACL|nr:aquaporin [Tumebacillus amylolyticus]MBL0388265.1 aquaporin [Tumebacillus amylolyticus]